MTEPRLDDRQSILQRRSIGEVTFRGTTYVCMVGIVVQVRVMRSIVPALYEGIIDIEPVVAVGVQ